LRRTLVRLEHYSAIKTGIVAKSYTGKVLATKGTML